MAHVLIYRSRLLPISETFVLHHAQSLRRYIPFFAGLRGINELELAGIPSILLEGNYRSTISLGMFKIFGKNHNFLTRLAAQKPDLIHAHFAVDAADMLPVAKALDIPLVVTLHGYDVTFTDAAFRNMGLEGRIFLAKRARLFREADRFLPVSRFIEGKARQAGVPPARSTLHYLGIDLARFTPPTGSRDNAVLYVGRLVEKKGLNLLIEAMARAGANETGTVLRVIGDGPRREEFLALAKAKLRHFEYLGAQPHGRVIEELGKASIFSVPSIPSGSGDNEGLPIAYLEASAMGIPVVSFAQGGILEAVVDETTGLLAPVGDVDALAARLGRLIADPERAVRLGAAGRAYVEAQFDMAKRSASLEDIYDEVIAAKRSARPARR